MKRLLVLLLIVLLALPVFALTDDEITQCAFNGMRLAIKGIIPETQKIEAEVSSIERLTGGDVKITMRIAEYDFAVIVPEDPESIRDSIAKYLTYDIIEALEVDDGEERIDYVYKGIVSSLDTKLSHGDFVRVIDADDRIQALLVVDDVTTTGVAQYKKIWYNDVRPGYRIQPGLGLKITISPIASFDFKNVGGEVTINSVKVFYPVSLSGKIGYLRNIDGSVSAPSDLYFGIGAKTGLGIDNISPWRTNLSFNISAYFLGCFGSEVALGYDIDLMLGWKPVELFGLELGAFNQGLYTATRTVRNFWGLKFGLVFIL